MTHAGRSVIVSGSTVAFGLLSMVAPSAAADPLDRDRRPLIPAVSVLTSLTLLAALLAMLGPDIKHIHVLPMRFVEGSASPAGSGGVGLHSSRAAPR